MNIKNVIYETLERENKNWVPKNHNPSSASFKYSDGRVVGKDLLSLYYKWTGVAPSNPPGSGALLTFRLGDGVHNEIAKILAKAGIKAMSEVAGKSSVPGLKNQISYRVDGLHELDGDLEVIEVKSSTDDAMFNWKNISIEHCGPKEDHMLQVLCYLNLVPGVKRARLLYVSRDKGSMLEFVIEKYNQADTYTITPVGRPTYVQPELNFCGIVSRWVQLEKHVETQTAPSPEFKIWVREDGTLQESGKQIKGVKYKNDWQAVYSPYLDKIYLDPKNFETATFNAYFKRKGLI